MQPVRLALKVREAAPVLDLCCHGHEGLLNICGVLGTGLQEGNADLVSKSLQPATAVLSDHRCFSCIMVRRLMARTWTVVSALPAWAACTLTCEQLVLPPGVKQLPRMVCLGRTLAVW